MDSQEEEVISITLEERTARWVSKCPLRKWREMHGYTQHELAGLVGCAPASLHYWEKGAAFPSGGGFQKLMAVIRDADFKTLMTKWYHSRPSGDSISEREKALKKGTG